MSMLYDVHNAYNNNNDDLDKLARQVNNNKKSFTKTVYDDFNNNNNMWQNGINNLTTNNEFPVSNTNISFENMKNASNYIGHGSLIKDVYPDNNDSGYSSLYDMSFDSSSIDTYLEIAKSDRKNKKHNELHDVVKLMHTKNCGNSHTKNCSGNGDYNDESTFDHIKQCRECKKKLMDLINNIKNDKNHVDIPAYNEKSNEYIINKNNSTKKKISKRKGKFISISQLKEILIMVMIGIFIILIIDIFVRSRK